jgi:hypothetical protein
MRTLIKKILQEGELDWIKQEPINPWMIYDSIVFDIEPSKKDVVSYIKMALYTKNIGNADLWELTTDSGADSIIKYVKNYGSAHLSIHGKDMFLQYGVIPRVSENQIKYSQLINEKGLNESDDGLDWVREVPLYIPFDMVELGEKYYVELTQVFYDARKACGESLPKLIHTAIPDVVDMELRYNNVYCNHESERLVTALYLKFYDESGNEITRFWVTEDMVNLIPMESKKINESDDGLDWIRDIEVETDLTPAEIKIKYDTFPLELVGPNMSSFSDIHWEGGKLMLYINHWEDLSELFEDNDSSQYGYINKFLAEKVLAEDDYWEPYHDVIGDWRNDVWDLVTDDKKLLDYIKDYIRENDFIGQELESEEDPNEMGFREDMLLDDNLLGELIEAEPMFEDLKRELSWSYESAYNYAARDNVWKAAYEALEGILGKGEWTSFENRRGHTEHNLKFDVTYLVMNSVEESIEMCIDDCKRWFKPEVHYDVDEHSSESEAFEEFCEECTDWPFTEWGDFVSFYANHLNETNDMLNPRFNEWPNSDDIAEFFVEDVYGRI